jgi:hypothetical protein
MSLGYGSLYSVSRKQTLNTTSSTEAELVGVHEVDRLDEILYARTGNRNIPQHPLSR